MNAFEDARKFERSMISMVKALDALWYRGDYERRLTCVSDLDTHINQLEVCLSVLRQERARRKKRTRKTKPLNLVHERRQQ